MLVIRNEQIAVLTAYQVQSFERRALEYIRLEYPGAFEELGQENIKSMLPRFIQHAKHFGISAETGVIVWAELSIHYGENFYNEQPWAISILHNPELYSEAKAERLAAYIFNEY